MRAFKILGIAAVASILGGLMPLSAQTPSPAPGASMSFAGSLDVPEAGSPHPLDRRLAKHEAGAHRRPDGGP